MSEETPTTQEVPQYEPQPRGEARIAGINIEAIDARLAECEEYFQKHVDETDYRNLDWYLWRMQLRYAAGDDIFEVVDDAFMAARCLHDKYTMHLELKPPEMFMTRRIMPVELGIISGMPMLTLEFSATYGLPLMMVIGQTAPEDVMGEANLMTSFFRRGFMADFVELTGLSAVIYAGVIAAIGRGFDDEATLGLNTYAKARDSLRGKPPAALLPKIQRYDALNTALACLCAGQFEMIGQILAPEADAFEADQAKRCGDAWLAPDKMPPPKYFDTAILTVLALAALRGVVVELPETGAIAHYRDFIRGLTEMPERRLEIPGLDEETRRILKEVGVDPEKLGVDDSFQDEKEASEARAAALFEERQRRAQEAVRAKIERDRAEAEAAEAAQAADSSGGQDGGAQGESKAKSFDNFFSDDDEVDASARKANEDFDNHAAAAESQDSKDYASFFENDDTPRPDDTADENDVQETKDFGAFFSDDDREDDSIRTRIEEESVEAKDTGKNYASFFENDDQEDTSIRTHVEEEATEAQDTGKSYSSFFDNLDENAIPKFNDGSEDEAPEVRTYSSDFFSDDHKPLSGLKMELEPEPEPEPPKEEPVKTEAPKIERDQVEDTNERRDFSKFFDDSAPMPASDLKMSLDEEENAEKLEAAKSIKPVDERRNVDDGPTLAEEHQARDFSASFFDENDETRREMEDAYSDSETPHETAQTRDFNQFFEDESTDESEGDILDREAQLRELEAEQARKAEEMAKKQALKLELDGTEYEVKKTENYQQRMARLIEEKQAAAREQALREREEAMRELEELKKTGVAKPKVEQLQLKPTESTDPDEKVEKVAPEDLVIKGFAYTDLDMIHANTAERADVEEDFDMHAAMAEKMREEMIEKMNQKKEESDKKANTDDDIHVVIDYGSLASTDSSSDKTE
ncbi:MAG: hypothetical protein J6A01_13005 [Proteobacteria bacterium]|nr:hypothetical protein [Pseudomonadota bacterium]